jgi:hypothetical protein
MLQNETRRVVGPMTTSERINAKGSKLRIGKTEEKAGI